MTARLSSKLPLLNVLICCCDNCVHCHTGRHYHHLLCSPSHWPPLSLFVVFTVTLTAIITIYCVHCHTGRHFHHLLCSLSHWPSLSPFIVFTVTLAAIITICCVHRHSDRHYHHFLCSPSQWPPLSSFPVKNKRHHQSRAVTTLTAVNATIRMSLS